MTAEILAVDIELLNGTYDAQRERYHGELTSTDAMEWPPSPARLVAALVAVAYHSGRTDLLGILDGLCSLEPPVIYASKAVGASQPKRYVARTHKERPARDTQTYLTKVAGFRSSEGWLVDRVLHAEAFRAVPDNSMVRFLWTGNDVGSAKTKADLGFLCSRLGYLGRPSGQVGAWVPDMDGVGPPDELYRWEPFTSAGPSPSELAVPYPGFLAAIEKNRSAGVPFPVSASYRERRRYRTTQTEGLVHSPWRTHQWVIRGRRLNPAMTVPFAHAVRAQSLALCDSLPPQVTGHGANGVPHVGWWPVITDTTQRLIVAVPDSLACPPVPEQVRFDGSSLDLSPAVLDLMWTDQSSSIWVSLTPVPLVGSSDTRRRKNLNKQLHQAGLPSARSVSFSRSPLARGSLPASSYRLSRVGESPRAPGAHVLMVFDEPVKGLFAIGDLRYFGSGLMVPLSDTEGHP